MMMPVATPIAKFIPKSFSQNFVISSQALSPVLTYIVSIMAMIKLSPNVSGTNKKW